MKKSLSWSMGFLVVMVALALVVPAGAASKSKAHAKKAEKHTPAHWAVGAVDGAANTIELAKSDGSSNLTLKVTSVTKITVEGKSGKLADLQKGQKVNFTAAGENCSSIEVVATSESKKKK